MDSSFDSKYTAAESYDESIDTKIVKYLRDQKHDFMNDIQVIWGYLQLGKPSEAGRYIEKMNNYMKVLSSIFNLNYPHLSLLLYNHIRKAAVKGITIDFESEVENIDGAFSKYISDKLSIIGLVFDIAVNRILSINLDMILYVDIYDESDYLYIEFSNNSYDGFVYADEMNLSSIRSVVEKASEKGIYVSSDISAERANIRICFQYDRG